METVLHTALVQRHVSVCYKSTLLCHCLALMIRLLALHGFVVVLRRWRHHYSTFIVRCVFARSYTNVTSLACLSRPNRNERYSKKCSRLIEHYNGLYHAILFLVFSPQYFLLSGQSKYNHWASFMKIKQSEFVQVTQFLCKL